jgi:hypothetical protein
MKPTLPEDHELDKTGSEVSEHYRAGAQDEPSARVDAAIREAARGEVKPVRTERNWYVPVSAAVLLVLGFSMVLLVRESEPPMSSLDRVADDAKLAKSAPPQLAMKAQPKVKSNSAREARPSRERSERPDREPPTQDQAQSERNEAAQDNAGASVAATAAAPPVPAAAAPGKLAERDQGQTAQSGSLSESKKTDSMSDAAPQSRRSEEYLQKQKVEAAPAPPEDWVRRIDDLLAKGRQADAQKQLLELRKQFPDYAIPQRLQALLPDHR